jgi:hypothetical protein
MTGRSPAGSAAGGSPGRTPDPSNATTCTRGGKAPSASSPRRRSRRSCDEPARSVACTSMSCFPRTWIGHRVSAMRRSGGDRRPGRGAGDPGGGSRGGTTRRSPHHIDRTYGELAAHVIKPRDRSRGSAARAQISVASPKSRTPPSGRRRSTGPSSAPTRHEGASRRSAGGMGEAR